MVYQGKILGSASLPPIISSRGESDSGGMLKQVTATLWAQLIQTKRFAVFGASSDAKTQMLTILSNLRKLFSIFQSMPLLSRAKAAQQAARPSGRDRRARIQFSTPHFAPAVFNLDWICECVRSNSKFHPRNQDVDFGMLEMIFTFQCTKYEKNR